MTLVRWMSTSGGRAVRLVLGLALIAVGYLIGGIWGIVVGVIGLVPIGAAIFKVCLFAPLLGAPLDARRLTIGG